MAGDDIEHLLAVADAAAGRNPDAEHGLLAVVVHAPVEDELAAALRLEDGPAGEAARGLGDVRLGVAAVHAEGVQFQEFAAVVFVEAARALFAARLRGIGSDGLPVVEVEQHGGTLGGGFEQVFEFAENAGADDVAFVCGDQVAVGALIEVDVEVIEPEIRQDFVELAVAVDGAQQFAFGEIARDHLSRAARHFEAAAQFRRCDREQALAKSRRHGADELVLFFPGQRLEGFETLLGRALAKSSQLPRAGRFGRRGRRVSALGLALLKLLHQFGEHQPAVGVGREGKLPVDHLPDHLGRRVVAHQLAAGHVQRVQGLELFGKHRVLGDALRVELAVDPLLEAHRLHFLDVAGTGAEGEAVERLQDLLIAGKLLLKLAGRDRGQT